MKRERLNIKNYTVYKHTCPNGKVYIGITCQKPHRRWNNGNGYKDQIFYRAIQKYGWNNIKHEILYTNFTLEEANLMEQFLITLYDSTNPEKGYNTTLGGDGSLGRLDSEETKRKKSENHARHMLGKHHTEETKQLISELHRGNKYCLGRKASDETKKKMSEFQKNRVRSEEELNRLRTNFLGKHHTEETKQKISKKNSGGNNGMARKVICLNTDRVFDCIADAARWANIKSYSDITKCCKHKQKSAGKHPETKEPLRWSYYKEEVNE